jgi:hypothetical protein
MAKNGVSRELPTAGAFLKTGIKIKTSKMDLIAVLACDCWILPAKRVLGI